MVEEGGLSKVHISSQGGGWGELFTAQFFHFYSAVTSLKNQICLTTIRFLAVANNSSDTNVYRYILIKRTWMKQVDANFLYFKYHFTFKFFLHSRGGAFASRFSFYAMTLCTNCMYLFSLLWSHSHCARKSEKNETNMSTSKRIQIQDTT